MSREETSHDAQHQPLLLVRLQQNARLRRQYVSLLPWWRQPVVGYLLSIPLTIVGLLIPFVEQLLVKQNSFLGAPLFLVTVIVALLWGAGPAIFSILLGIVALDYYFLPPSGTLVLKNWMDIVPLIPYLMAELVVAAITSQREGARRRALFAEQEVKEYAEDLEQTNRQLKESNMLKDTFFSRASHELKTPLTAIRGQAQLGLRRLDKQEALPPELQSVRTALVKIDGQTHRLHALVDDLLDVSILSMGKLRLRRKRCDIKEICREVIEEQRMLSGRTIDLDLPQSPVIINADGDRLNQVMANLVTNAIKYSPEDSSVVVSVHPVTGGAMIEVHNEGPAIPREQQQNIFEPFYRTPNVQRSSKQGWGLGLAICKDIIEQHSGSIRVSSSKEAGTTFYVELPSA